MVRRTLPPAIILAGQRAHYPLARVLTRDVTYGMAKLSNREKRNEGSRTRWTRRANPRVNLPHDLVPGSRGALEYVERIISPASESLGGHRYVREGEWAVPAANCGGREIIFTLAIGRISDKSLALPTCSDPNCVNPLHVEIENRSIHAEKVAGTYDPFILGPERRAMRKSEYEKTLSVYPWRQNYGDARAFAKERADGTIRDVATSHSRS